MSTDRVPPSRPRYADLPSWRQRLTPRATPRHRWVKPMLIGLALGIALLAGFGPGGAGPSRPLHEGSVAAAIKYVHDHQAHLAPGVATAVVSPSGSAAAGFGTATADTPFVLGSVSKSFTALAVLQLAEAGKVDLARPVVDYLPRFRTDNPERSAMITVRQLLTHSSGLPPDAGQRPLRHGATSIDSQTAALRTVTAAEPGGFAYSNANYEVLGAMIQAVSGQDYGSYVRDHIFIPLDMRHSYTDLASARRAGLTHGHRVWFGITADDGHYYRPDFLPAGFLISTATDLTHYLTALLDGGSYAGRSVLSPAGIRTLTGPAVDASALGAHRTYGLGWYQQQVGPMPTVWHPGSAHDVHADLVLVPGRHTAIALLTNSEYQLDLVIPKVDVAAANVAAIACGYPTRHSLEHLYLVIDTLLLTLLLVFLRTLVTVFRRRTAGYTGHGPWTTALAAWRELGFPLLVGLELPRALGAPWSVLIRDDLSAGLACLALIGLATAAIRGSFALRARRGTSSRSAGRTGGTVKTGPCGTSALAWRAQRHRKLPVLLSPTSAGSP
jgi:CubicO group peptidase (beta-lactamase class C family)